MIEYNNVEFFNGVKIIIIQHDMRIMSLDYLKVILSTYYEVMKFPIKRGINDFMSIQMTSK
jgi:hypothetical protein